MLRILREWTLHLAELLTILKVGLGVRVGVRRDLFEGGSRIDCVAPFQRGRGGGWTPVCRMNCYEMNCKKVLGRKRRDMGRIDTELDKRQRRDMEDKIKNFLIFH